MISKNNFKSFVDTPCEKYHIFQFLPFGQSSSASQVQVLEILFNSSLKTRPNIFGVLCWVSSRQQGPGGGGITGGGGGGLQQCKKCHFSDLLTVILHCYRFTFITITQMNWVKVSVYISLFDINTCLYALYLSVHFVCN